MNSELKNQINQFILENKNEFQLLNATVKEFHQYIFDKKGEYISGGIEIYKCIEDQIEILTKRLPELNTVQQMLTDTIIKNSIAKMVILAQYKAKGLTISRVYKVDTSKLIKIGGYDSGYNYIDYVTGEGVNMCVTIGMLLDLLANGNAEVSNIESLYLIK